MTTVPPAFMIREATPGDVPGIARVHVETWHTTYRGIVPDDILDNLTIERRSVQWERTLSLADARVCVCVALDVNDSEIIGFANGGPQRDPELPYEGELYALYVLKVWQGRGVGRALTTAVARYLHAQAMRGMLVWVLSDNPSCRFYEALGGRFVKEQPLDFNGTPVMETGFAWTNLADFSGHAPHD